MACHWPHQQDATQYAELISLHDMLNMLKRNAMATTTQYLLEDQNIMNSSHTKRG